ncbi:hypothetical protein Tco_1445937 [Tanacetum coccineum]
MCKAYGGEPSVDLLRAFLNLGPAGNWLTLSNRGGSSVPKALTKPIIHIEGCKGNFFFIENKIVPSEYPELLLEENKLDKKSFKDVIPTHARDDPLYNQIATYPCNVRTFPDPILYLAGLKTSWKHSPKKPIIYYRRREIDFRSFMMEGIYGEFHFLPEGGAGDEGSSPSTKSVNSEASIIDAKPLTAVHPLELAENIGDFGDASSNKDEVTLIDRTIAEKAQNRKVLPHASKASSDASNPLDVDSDPDIHGKFLASHASYVVAHVTPPTWKQHLKEISLEKLYDIHDIAYMRQAILDNMLNNRTRKFMSTLLKARASCDAIREREVEKDKAYVKLERRCITFKEVAALKEPFDLEKIPGYRPSSKKEFNQVGDDLATASYPFISEAIVDPYASLEELLSKKPKSLRSKPTSSNLKPSSLKAPNLVS